MTSTSTLDRKQQWLKQIHRVTSNLHILKFKGQADSWEQLAAIVNLPPPKHGPINLPEARDWLASEARRISQADPDSLFSVKAVGEEDEEIPSDFLSTEAIVREGNFKCTLFKDQLRTVRLILYNVLERKQRGGILQATTGQGKTFVYGAVLRYLTNIGWIDQMKDCVTPTKIMVVTRASIVHKTQYDLRAYFGFRTELPFWHPQALLCVTSIDQVRNTFGTNFVDVDTIVQSGEPVEVIRWRKFVTPTVWVHDECHMYKNEDSQQAKLRHALNEYLFDVDQSLQMDSSATPVQRVADAKYLVLGAQLRSDFGYEGNVSVVTPAKWKEFSESVAAPADPMDYNAASVERLMKEISPHVWPIKGGRWQFKARNRVSVIPFDNDIDRRTYETAWKRYQEELALLNRDTPDGHFAILAMFQKFRQAAELIRAPYIAREAVQIVAAGKAFVGFCEFKATIGKVLSILVSDYGVPRERVTLIWGGLLKKRPDEATKIRLLGRLETFTQVLKQQGLDEAAITEFSENFIDKHGLGDESEDEKTLRQLGFGAQSKKERQAGIDRYQRGEADYALLTFKAGGAGLSLHHTDEFTKQKVRRDRESNYAVLSDIPSIPTKPRETILTPVYSGIEMIQGLGRAPRRTSLSDTDQRIIYYAGTIEEEVAAISKQKMKCIGRATVVREDWYDLVGAKTTTTEEEDEAETIDQDNMEILD